MTAKHLESCGSWRSEDAEIKHMTSFMTPQASYVDRKGMTSEIDGFPANVFCSLWYNSYAYYQFLVLTNLSSMPPQDYKFLEQQGCLHIPAPTILDDFVRHYFLYVHPILPIIDEGAFWDIYSQRFKPQPCCNKLSLLLFQSMLFSCCNFLPQTTLAQLGLETTRRARAIFYRRAKLLFDLDTESSSMAKSQAALLLASYSFSAYEAPRMPNIPWLSIAMHNARDAEAHKYDTFDVNSEEHAVRKRLWWGCIIRDRILALGMRRAMLLTSEQFTIVGNIPLCRFDLADEATQSLVYDFETKVLLGDILGLLVELCIILTDILDLAFPIEDCLKHGRTNAEAGRQIQNCQKALAGWRREATIRLPTKSQTSQICRGEQEGSLVLFANLLWIASQVALGHYEILRTAAITTAASPSDAPENTQKHLELQTAAIGTVGCLEELVASQLIKRLPVTAISCTALPLLLHFLDMELSSAAVDNENPQRLELLKYRLKILKSDMEVYRLQYEGVGWVSDAINQVVKLAQAGIMTDAEPSMLQRSRPGSIGVSGSIEALNFQPRWYIRIAFTIDVAFSKGRLPDDAQFLRSFNGFGMFETKPLHSVQGVRHDHPNGKVLEPIVTATSIGAAAVSSEGLHCMGEEGGSEYGGEEVEPGLAVNGEDGEASERNMETTDHSDTTTTDCGTVLGQQKLTQSNMVGAGALGETGLTAEELDIFFMWEDEGPDSSQI
ncbi:fungal specific transcription factor domain-containing protein [Colletotrichum limetticola]|uniref:Fungal specific transcription factor domain-containing protein n=1 Tax=Colletotrichum limetticola TaxID=1209924 RepID=A0ABQ9PW29_9PEZI|nr:fungal specific transcription factor domain-containing protein [Colletotrichum limetticola]